MKPANVPDTAVPLPPSGGGFLAQQADQIRGILTEVARENENTTSVYGAACLNWTMANLRNRDLGLSLTAKPVPPLAQVVKTSSLDPDGVVWVWIAPGDPLGAPCPDLPPVPVAPGPNHVHVGRRIYANWFSTGLDDTYDPQGPPVTTTSDDGVAGIFHKYPAPVGNGWYLQIG